MNPGERQRRKAELEHLIEQQRVDLLVAADQWHAASEPIDAGWRKLMRFKAPLLAAGGWLLYRGARRPLNLSTLARRLSTGVVMYKAAKRMLD